MSRSLALVAGLVAAGIGSGLVAVGLGQSPYTPEFVVGSTGGFIVMGLVVGLVARRGRRWVVAGLLALVSLLAGSWLFLDAFSLCMGLGADCFPNRHGVDLWLAAAVLGVSGFLLGSRAQVTFGHAD